MKNINIGLVLGGGGARGLAHIGVIKGLIKNGITIRCITGASMGAIVGAAFAFHNNIVEVEQKFKNFVQSEDFSRLKNEQSHLGSAEKPEGFFHFISKVVKRQLVIHLAANRKGLVTNDHLKRAIQFIIPEGNIEHTKIPFACTALNLVNGNEKIFTSGDLHQALMASASIPGFLPPMVVNSDVFVDGAVINSFPIEICRAMKADFVIASDVAPELGEMKEFNNIIEIFIRTHRSAVRKLNQQLLNKADFVLKPDIGDKDWTDFEAIDFFIKRGEQVVEQKIEDLKSKIKRQKQPLRRLKNYILSK